MSSTSEQVIAAVVALATAAWPDAKVSRNQDSPDDIPSGGLAVVRDGTPGDPEFTLSPLTYTYAHAVRIELAVTGATPAERRAKLDAMLVALGEAVEADRTLGGLCEWLEPVAPERGDMRTEGAATASIADLDVIATYSTPNPLT